LDTREELEGDCTGTEPKVEIEGKRSAIGCDPDIKATKAAVATADCVPHDFLAQVDYHRGHHCPLSKPVSQKVAIVLNDLLGRTQVFDTPAIGGEIDTNRLRELDELLDDQLGTALESAQGVFQVVLLPDDDDSPTGTRGERRDGLDDEWVGASDTSLEQVILGDDVTPWSESKWNQLCQICLAIEKRHDLRVNPQGALWDELAVVGVLSCDPATRTDMGLKTIEIVAVIGEGLGILSIRKASAPQEV
jgi:hypothetical protein